MSKRKITKLNQLKFEPFDKYGEPIKGWSWHNISFDKVIQKDQLQNGSVPLVIFTDPTIESEMQIALEGLADHPEVLNSKIIRIEDL